MIRRAVSFDVYVKKKHMRFLQVKELLRKMYNAFDLQQHCLLSNSNYTEIVLQPQVQCL